MHLVGTNTVEPSFNNNKANVIPFYNYCNEAKDTFFAIAAHLVTKSASQF